MKIIKLPNNFRRGTMFSCAAVGALLLSYPVSAELLNDVTEYPSTEFLTGQVAYDSGAQLLSLDLDPTRFQREMGDPHQFFQVGDSLVIGIMVDDAGNVTGGVAGDDPVLAGTVDPDGAGGDPAVSGTLRRSRCLWFYC